MAASRYGNSGASRDNEVYPAKLSFLTTSGEHHPHPPGRTRTRKLRPRQQERFKTQPVTLNEIKEVDEEEEAPKADELKGQLAVFSRSIDGLFNKLTRNSVVPIVSVGDHSETPTTTTATTTTTTIANRGSTSSAANPPDENDDSQSNFSTDSYVSAQVAAGISRPLELDEAILLQKLSTTKLERSTRRSRKQRAPRSDTEPSQ